MLFLTPFYLQYLTSVSLFVSLVPYFSTDDRNKKIDSGFSIKHFYKIQGTTCQTSNVVA